jgi:Recombination endonuclease VII
MEETKDCISCARSLPLSEFRKNRREKDGLEYYCNSCRALKVQDRVERYEQAHAAAPIDPASVKACRECGVVKPLLDFSPRRDQADGHHWWCIDCKRAKDRAYGKVYRERNPEQKRQSARKYIRREDLHEQRSRKVLWEKYKLTPEMMTAKIEEQGGCPFCPPGTEVLNWDVDHDHDCCPTAKTCGKCIRDMLCHKHNLGLGYWNDNPDLLRQAADYIDAHRARINPQPKTPQPELWGDDLAS